MDSKMVLVVYKQPPSHFLHCCQLGDPKIPATVQSFLDEPGLEVSLYY